MKYLKNEHDARDAVQQVFEKAIAEIQKYEVVYFKSWLYMIAKNHCLMQLRGKHNHSIANADDLELRSDAENALQAEMKKEADVQILYRGIGQLNAEQKQCVTLFYLQKKTYFQISEATGLNMMQVKSAIQNGKRNLKIYMQRMQPNE